MLAKNEKVKPLEKLFFAYILKNPVFFHRVEPPAFKNANIQFVYTRVRNYYLSAKNPHVPSPKVIWELVRIDDHDGAVISDDFIKALLTIDIKDYTSGQDDDWLRKQIQSWCTSNNIFNRVSEAAVIVRTIDPTNAADVMEKTEKIRAMLQDASLVSYGDEDLGLDFDDPEAHVQDTKFNKVSTGWMTLDELLSGGWDRKTLNMVIGPSNSGKSLWLSNIAVNAANEGKNVLYVSLEMSDKKIMKRLGAIRLRININEYDAKSKDVDFIKERISATKKKNSFFGEEEGLFAAPMGKLYVKEFPAGSATIADVDSHIKNLQEKKGVKIDLVVVDYLTIMCPDKNNNGSLFTNGKQLSEGLRAIAQKHDLVMVSAMQVQKDNFGANDITLADIAESKAIVETADTMFGIIRTDNMRKEGVYILKLLKLRDGDFKWEKTHFKLNREYLAIEGDKRMDLG